MRRHTDFSDTYKDKDGTLYFIEGKADKGLNRYIRGHRSHIEHYLQQHGVIIREFNIISTAMFGERSPKNLLLRQCPAIGKRELEQRLKKLRERVKKSHSRIVYVCDTTTGNNGICSTEILSEEDFTQDCGYEVQLYKFLDAIVHRENERTNKYSAINAIRYRLPDEEEDECNGYLAHDLLAESICDTGNEVISPLHFDSRFNMHLPLYPQITIKLAPLPKSLFILLLLHPEGVVLKEINDYEEELRNIYSSVSGRKNPTVINKMFKALTDPTGNPLQKNLSIIRKCFSSKLNYRIARNYIPASGRGTAQSIPLDSRLIEMPKIG